VNEKPEPNESKLTALIAWAKERFQQTAITVRTRFRNTKRPPLQVWIVIAIGITFIWWIFSPSHPPEPTARAPEAPPTPLLEPHHIWAIGSFALLLAVVGISLNVGAMALSSQTLTHRRNVILGGVLLVLSELFNVDALKALSIDPHIIPQKTDGTQFTKQEVVFGLLVIFIVFSFAE